MDKNNTKNSENGINHSNDCLHHGHRERMRKKISEGYVQSFTDVELLEVLLFGVIKRQNTNIIAHLLLEKYGTPKAVFEADPSLITELDGLGASSSCFFTLLKEINRRIMLDKGTPEKYFPSIEKIGQFFIKRFKGISEERVMLLMLDNKNAFIDCKTLSEGTLSSAFVSPRVIVKAVLDAGAASVVLAHNHPNGDPSPSDEDVVVTRTMRRLLADLEIDLVEHIIVSDDRYIPVMAYITAVTENRYGEDVK